MLVRPAQQRIVVYALVNRAPAGTSLGLALEGSVARTHQRLADVVEAVRGVVRDFSCEVCAAVALLEVLYEVRLLEVVVSMDWSRGRARDVLKWQQLPCQAQVEQGRY